MKNWHFGAVALLLRAAKNSNYLETNDRRWAKLMARALGK